MKGDVPRSSTDRRTLLSTLALLPALSAPLLSRVSDELPFERSSHSQLRQL